MKEKVMLWQHKNRATAIRRRRQANPIREARRQALIYRASCGPLTWEAEYKEVFSRAGSVVGYRYLRHRPVRRRVQ